MYAIIEPTKFKYTAQFNAVQTAALSVHISETLVKYALSLEGEDSAMFDKTIADAFAQADAEAVNKTYH